MIIHCVHCGTKLTPNEELEKDHGTSVPIKCDVCKAVGFVTFMQVDPKSNIITGQMIKRILT